MRFSYVSLAHASPDSGDRKELPPQRGKNQSRARPLKILSHCNAKGSAELVAELAVIVYLGVGLIMICYSYVESCVCAMMCDRILQHAKAALAEPTLTTASKTDSRNP